MASKLNINKLLIECQRYQSLLLYSEIPPVFFVGHASFDLGHCARNVIGQILVACFCYKDHILDSDARDLGLILANLVSVQVTQIELIEVSWDLTIEEEIAEVATRLNSDNITFFDDSCSAHVGKSWLASALRRVSQIASDIVSVETDEMTKTVRHEDESNSLLHHFIDAACEHTELNKTLQRDPLRQLMALNPVGTWLEFLENGSGCLKHDIVDLSLLLCETTIDREGNRDIRAIVLEGVALISQHGLTVDQCLVVVLVMKGCSCGSAATN